MGFFDKLREILPTVDMPDRDLLDRPNLRRTVVDNILQLRQRGRRGIDTLPAAVTITVTIADGSVGVVRRFVDDPSFDQEIEAELLNRLVGTQSDSLPVRAYVVEAGERSSVSVTDAASGTMGWIRVLDGDAAGRSFPISIERAEHRLGRTVWHGEGGLPNDIIASEQARFVSRRAAVIERVGSGIMIRALDQKDCLVIVRESGRRVRPSHTRAQRVRLESGDHIELTDGGEQSITLVFSVSPPEEE